MCPKTLTVSRQPLDKTMHVEEDPDLTFPSAVLEDHRDVFPAAAPGRAAHASQDRLPREGPEKKGPASLDQPSQCPPPLLFSLASPNKEPCQIWTTLARPGAGLDPNSSYPSQGEMPNIGFPSFRSVTRATQSQQQSKLEQERRTFSPRFGWYLAKLLAPKSQGQNEK